MMIDLMVDFVGTPTAHTYQYISIMADSPNDERMEDDLEESDLAAVAVDLDELRNLLEELTSTRLDVQTPSGRNARIQLATEALSTVKDGRQLLARMGKGACAEISSVFVCVVAFLCVA